MPEPITCEAIQYSDQKRCDRCNLVWDMNDQYPPQCLTAKQLSDEIEQAAVKQILDRLKD